MELNLIFSGYLLEVELFLALVRSTELQQVC